MRLLLIGSAIATVVFVTAASADLHQSPRLRYVRELTPAADSDIVFDSAEVELRDGKSTFRLVWDATGAPSRSFNLWVDSGTRSYRAKIHHGDAAGRPRHARTTAAGDWCHTYQLDLATLDPAHLEVALTTAYLSWYWDAATAGIRPLGGYDQCWAKPKAGYAWPADTQWYTDFCSDTSPEVQVGSIEQTGTGNYSNWDWGEDDEITTVSHQLKIGASGNTRPSALTFHDVRGESSSLLWGRITETYTEWNCGGSVGGTQPFEPSPCTDEEWCECPLILDMNDDGIATTSLRDPVLFDIDDDGAMDSVAWTTRGGDDAFLWIDLNDNGRVDSGAELFGTAMILPTGARARNGFEALAYHDKIEYGGNADGRVSSDDEIWDRLRLWVDRNHDGVSSHDEIETAQAAGVVELPLGFVSSSRVDRNGNNHQFRGSYTRRIVKEGKPRLVGRPMHDVFFAVAPRP